jgi:dolichol-phosphate mannosyltransferase
VAPFFNEEQGVEAFYAALTAVLDTLALEYDLVLVDDGSQDRTLELLNRLADQASNVTVLSLARNFGHQAALTAGIDVALGDVVITMDSDLQHPPSLIPRLIQEYVAVADIVYAARNQSQELPFLKRVTSEAYYGLMRRIARIEMVPNAADFRLMSQEVVNVLRSMREMHRSLRGIIPWIGFQSAIVTYDQPNRFAGTPTYTWRKSLKLARHGLFSFTTLPLELITIMGLVLTFFAFIYLIYIFIVSILGHTVTGWTSLITVMLVIGGVQLTSIGIIAQYIGMIFEQVKARPLYTLKQSRLSPHVQEIQTPAIPGYSAPSGSVAQSTRTRDKAVL